MKPPLALCEAAYIVALASTIVGAFAGIGVLTVARWLLS